MTPTAVGLQPLVEMRGVAKSYGSGAESLTVLHGVDLLVEEGEYVGLVGASGSGKTTLMNLIGCLDRPSHGSYRLAGEDVSHWNDDRLSAVRNRSIGFVFQSFHLVPELTVLENIEVPMFYARKPRRERRGMARTLAESVGLGHRGEHVPSKLSGGECQRVAVARALANDPRLLLADEPTGNLDSTTGEEILRLFEDLHRRGRTIVMVTHNPEIAARLPRIVELRDGRVLADRRAATGRSQRS
jgi:putative ABC transport system ATP-binding protein